MEENVTAKILIEKLLNATDRVLNDTSLSEKEKADIVLQYMSATESAVKIENYGY